MCHKRKNAISSENYNVLLLNSKYYKTNLVVIVNK